MPRFFIPTEQMGEGSVTVLGADAFHIARALRMACGEEIVVDEETLLDGGIDCPNCGEPLEFELEEDEEDEEE